MATGGREERVIVSLKVNFKGNTVVLWIILPLDSNYSATQLCEKLFSGELSDDKDIKLPTHMNPTKNNDLQYNVLVSKT